MAGNGLSGFLGAGAGAGGAAGGRSQVDAILDAVRNHLGMEIAFASKYVDGRREFTHLSADIPLPAGPGDSEPVEETFCWNILQGRLPEMIQNAADFPLAQTLPITGALPVGCHVNVPLKLKDGTVYGSFCCLSRTPDYSLTGRDMAALKAFADLAADQIELERDADEERRIVAERIALALRSGGPSVLLQPIHRLDTGRTAGAEALARFGGPGERPPNFWFDEGWAVGRGVELELSAVGNALALLPYMPADHYLSVNVSPETVLSGQLEPVLAQVAGGNVVLEVTEHSRVDDYPALRGALAAVRQHVRLAVDDVGAGYSGLKHIIALGPDILKLDMSLTRDIDTDHAKRALTVALVSFAARIGSVIVAEGIERTEEQRVLRDLGVTHGQGWLFSRAMPAIAAQQTMLGCIGAPEQSPPAPAWRPRFVSGAQG